MTAGDVYRALWRHKLFILVLTAVCVGAAWYATSLQEKTYEASTLIRIQQRRTADPGQTFAALQASQRLARTYAEIIGSGALRGRIAAQVGEQAPADELSKVALSAEHVEDLDLLWISARSEDPATSAIVANAVPPVLRVFSQTTGPFGDQIVTVRPASMPSSPVSPNTGLNVIVALVLALVFNSALVLLFELFRDRLPETEELGAELGYPVLATVPTLRLRGVPDVEATHQDAVLSLGGTREGTASREHEPEQDRWGGDR